MCGGGRGKGEGEGGCSEPHSKHHTTIDFPHFSQLDSVESSKNHPQLPTLTSQMLSHNFSVICSIERTQYSSTITIIIETLH